MAHVGDSDTEPAERDSWLPLYRLIDKRQALGLALLSLGAAFTEGLGLVLLVPMLEVLAQGAAGSSVSRLFGTLGLAPSLPVLLTLFVGLVLLRALLNYRRRLAGHRMEIAVTDGLRGRAWRALLHCDWRVLAQMRQSDSASLLISSVDRVGMCVNQLLLALVSALTLAGIALAALAISPRITVLAVFGGGLVLFAYRRMRRRAGQLGRDLNHAYARIHAEVGEGLAGLRIVKTFAAETRYESRLGQQLTALRTAQGNFIRDIGIGQILLQGAGALLLAGMIGLSVGAWHADLTRVLPLVALFARAVPLLGALQEAWQNADYARPALTRSIALIELAEAAREPDAPPGLVPPEALTSIGLRGVTVAYQGRPTPALDGIDLRFEAGTLTLILGPSGAGKSTLADVLCGLIAPDAGTMEIDGEPLDDGLRRAWRQRVAYVQQDAVLFSGSVRDNLLLSDPAADEAALLAALRHASATFVERLPAGLDTLLGEGGRQLSGGERQRLALARALLRRPRLLILDEATSALDADNERAIAQAIAGMKADFAIVVISHRGALAELADRTVRIEHGRIASVE